MSGIIIKGKDWSKEEDAEKKKDKKDLIRNMVGQVGSPMGKIYPGRIKSILNGDAPVVKFYAGGGVSRESHSEGETWTDKEGKTWQKRNGVVYRIDNEDLMDFLVETRKSLELPKVCPKCSRELKNTKINRKFWSLYNQCADCVIEEHTRMKIDGRWTKFEETKLLERERDYFKDILVMIKDTMKNDIKKVHEYVNEDGKIEKWENTSYAEQTAFFENEIKEIETRLEEIDKRLKELE